LLLFIAVEETALHSGTMVTKEMAKNMPTIQQCPEMSVLRDYVTAGDTSRYDGLKGGDLRLDVTHSNLVQRWHDILFNENMSIMDCKEKLYRHGGTSCCMQELYLRRGPGDTIFLAEENRSLAYYGCKSGMEIHIKDLDPHSLSANGGLEDVSQVEKYVMPDEEYDKMANTVRAQKRAAEVKKAKEEAAKRAAGELDEVEEKADANALTLEEVEAAFPVGSRCECDPGVPLSYL